MSTELQKRIDTVLRKIQKETNLTKEQIELVREVYAVVLQDRFAYWRPQYDRSAWESVEEFKRVDYLHLVTTRSFMNNLGYAKLKKITKTWGIERTSMLDKEFFYSLDRPAQRGIIEGCPAYLLLINPALIKITGHEWKTLFVAEPDIKQHLSKSFIDDIEKVEFVKRLKK